MQMGVNVTAAMQQLRHRLSLRSAEQAGANTRARAVLPLLAKRLKGAGAQRVVLFGSLVMGLYDAHSDIDLAVSGLSERQLAVLERELTLEAHTTVELANLDTMPAVLQRQLDRFGQELS